MTAAPRAARISALVALLLAAVWLFWPSTLGGSTVYVTTHGVSMEPRFHTGDLAVLRAADAYAVGDVVAYRSESLDTTVMHRIASLDGDRFVLQGDNNSWLDPDHPTDDLVLGKLWLRVPQGGRVLAALSSPVSLAILAAAAVALAGAARNPRGRRKHGSSGRRGSLPSFSTPIRAQARQAALVSGAVALIAGVGAGVLLAVPSTQTNSGTLQVIQRGQFSYTGHAEAGTTYPDGVVSTGDTVWTRLASDLTVSFENTLSGPDLADVRGAMRLDVSVASADGWSAYLNSSPDVAFDGGAVTAKATADLDTARAWELLGKHFAEIGTPVASATLVVTPVVATVGTSRGVAFETGSPDPLTFALDAASLRLPAGSGPDALTPSTQTPVTVEEIVPRRLSLLSVEIPISLARIVVIAVLGLALLTLAGGAWIGWRGRGDVADEFVVRHAARILPVAAFEPGPTVSDVSDPEALHRVAERFDTLVLHHAGTDEDVFAVRDVDATYRFVVPGGRGARSRPPVPAPVRVPDPEPDDFTAPLPAAVPAPQTSVSGGLWSRFA